MPQSAALYESFNARNLSPRRIAETFVKPDEFRELCGNFHVLLMGPRGSGKTTLLKMLTVEALFAWRDPLAAMLRSELEFTAVYVPTDVHWYHQLRHSARPEGIDVELAHRFSEAAVTTNILSALIRTMRERIEFEELEEIRSETDLCGALLQAWQFSDVVPAFPAIVEALTQRMNDIYIQIGTARLEATPQDAVRALPTYFSLDYLAACRVGCEAFDQSYRGRRARKWALCFDELELAPDWLQTRLFGELRSTDERFLFKLSTSPLPSVDVPPAATSQEDFRILRLWPHRNKSPRVFCDKLARSILQRHLGQPVDPGELLGVSQIGHDSRDDEYVKGGLTWSVFRDVAATDPDFRRLLRRHHLDPEDPSTEDLTKRNRVLRKAKPIAYFRHYFVKVDHTGQPALRSRKLTALYSGTEDLYDITDGNPRWLKAILGQLLDNLKTNPDGSTRSIAPEVQARIFHSAADEFASFVRALPARSAFVGRQEYDLDTLLSYIGRFFFASIVRGKFSLDPHGSFRVDNGTSEEMEALLRVAAYQGAIVLVDPSVRGLQRRLAGYRFRLGYLLAPRFRLPLRLYKEVLLSRCLDAQISRQPRSSEQSQLPLEE